MKSYTVRLSEEERRDMEQLARDNGLKLVDVIRMCIIHGKPLVKAKLAPNDERKAA